MNTQDTLNTQEQEAVGEKIRAKRLRLKLRIIDLSNRVGLTPGYISKIEQNVAKYPSDTILYRIAIELGLDPAELIKLKEQNKTAKAARKEYPAPALEAATSQSASFQSVPTALFQQDIINAVSQVKFPQPFQAEYVKLAEAYNSLGLRCCTTPAEDGTLEYQAGLAAYQAAEVFYARAGHANALCELHYRMARTYQNLVVTDRVRADERLFFLYRASALADQAFVGGVDKDNVASDGITAPRWSHHRLRAASLAIGATLNKLIAVELRGQSLHDATSSDQRHALQMELDTLASAANVRRIQADALYSVIIDGLQAERLSLLDPSREWSAIVNVYSELADVFRLKAINWRGKETGQQALLLPRRAENDQEPGRHNLEQSLAFLKDSVESQRAGTHILEKWGTVDGSFSDKQAHVRNLLAKFHQEWGVTFSQSDRDDWFAQTLWQFGLSQEVSSPGWGKDEYTAGDQFMTEFIMNMQADATDAQGDDTELYQRVLAVSIRADLDRLKKSGAFMTLDYPLMYEAKGLWQTEKDGQTENPSDIQK